MKNLKGKTALVTGASSGIGRAFAIELAKKEVNLIITARSENKLEQLAAEIRNEYHVRVLAISGDLSLKETPGFIFKTVTEKGWEPDILINNAGFGKWSGFLDTSRETYEEMLMLNINALVKLTHFFIPAMLKNKSGGIINIASTGAFQPCPYIAVYCASKAFVLSFSEALYGEYHPKGVTVTVVCPGNTSTGFQETAGADITGMSSDTPQKVAIEGIEAFIKGKNYKINGMSNYLQSFLPRLLPRKTVIGIVGNMMKGRVNGK